MTFSSVRYQIAQHTDEAAQPGILRFISKCICITPFGTLHRKSRHTICPQRSPDHTSGLLACLVLDQQTKETTFVSYPADRAFGALTRPNDCQSFGFVVIAKRCFELGLALS